ncbi:MAG: galactose mutarotase [Defluviitaleaceae bacterium]|nr:galactose mutarotase [Defluviitaleaceae bacterium]
MNTTITTKNWGTAPCGQAATLYTVKNDYMEFTISNYGGIITSIKTPDKNGVPNEICLGYDTLQEYIDDKFFVGCMVGRYSNRIEDGKLPVNGVVHQLIQNEGTTHLHGGNVWNKRVWNAKITNNGIILKMHSPDGDCGYPGNMDVEIGVYLNRNAILMEFNGLCDKDTYISLTTHAYFNLRGPGKYDVLDHKIKVNASRFTPLTSLAEGQLPTGEIASLTGNRFHYDNFRNIEHPDSDINFVLDNDAYGLAAEVYDEVTGRSLKMFTDYPCVQFYASEKMPTHNGRKGELYEKNCGLCLEPQFFPNRPNNPTFPGGPHPAGVKYEHKIAIEFGMV